MGIGKDKGLEDILRNLSPKILGAGAAIGSFLLIKDASVDMMNFGTISEFPVLVKALEVGVLGFLTYTIAENIAYRFLFRRKKDCLEKRIETEKSEDGEEIHGKNKKKGIVSAVLEHPLTASFISTLPVLYHLVINPVYKYVYKAWMYKNIFETNRDNAIAKFGLAHYEQLIHDADRIIEITSYQVIPMGAILYLGVLGVGAMAINLANIFLNKRYSVNSKKRLLASYLEEKDHDKAVKLLEEAIETLPTRGTYFQLGTTHLKNNKVDLALRAYSDGIKTKTKKSPYDKLLENVSIIRNPMIKLYKRYKLRIRKEPDNPTNYLNLAALHWKLPNRNMAFEVMDSAEKEFPNDAGFRCLHSIMLEETDRERSRKKLREAVEIIKHDPELRKKMRIVDESAHRIYELESPFLGSMFKFKEGPADRFMGEAMLTLYLRKMLGNYPQFETVEPIDIFSDELGGLYVMKHAQGTPLSAIGGQRFYYYLAAAEALGLVHAVMPRNLGKINHYESLKPAIYDSAFLDEKTKTGLFGACAGILQGFDHLPPVFMKDHHPKNILIGKEKGQHDFRLILLDFDDKGAAYASFDTAKLTEQGSNFENSFIGDQRRFDVVKRYVESFNEHERDRSYKIPSTEEFFISHLKSAVIKALSFYFFSARMPAREQERVSFIENAAHCINVLKEWFSDEYNRGEPYYKSMGGLLASLPKTNKELADPQRISPD